MIKPRRDTPRRRTAHRADAADWEEINLLLYRRSGDRCECCGKPLLNQAERHHRMRRRDGGDTLSNLLLLLPDHHKHWTEHPAEAVNLGIIVPTWASVADTPVLHGSRGWVTLAEDGTATPVPTPAPGQTPTRTG